MLDIRHIRQNPGLYEQNCVDRNYKHLSQYSWTVLALHKEWQELQRTARGVREQSNAVRRQLASAAASPDSHSPNSSGVSSTADGGGSPRTALLEEARGHKAKLDGLLSREAELETQMEALALSLPNLSSHSTPAGTEPIELRTFGSHPDSLPDAPPRTWRSHVQIGTELGVLDFAAAAGTSGWGWYFLLDEAVVLENALVQYALSVVRRRAGGAWRVVSPPSVVYEHVAAACGFQPRDANGETQIYSLNAGSGRAAEDGAHAKAGLCLAGTAEIPFAGMKAGTTVDEADLPLQIIGASRCYRAEAGARGVDTKGLYRVHEFTKVEMFAWTLPDTRMDGEGSYFDTSTPAQGEDVTESDPSSRRPGTAQQAVFEEMLSVQEDIMAGLGLHGRVLEMPATDLGASAQRKVDIEVFFPSRRAARGGGWGEVTSLSTCGDYQTRRLGTRLRRSKSGKLEWPFTVNGTAMAVPRVLAAVLEMGWDEAAGCVRVPEVLWPWTDGMRVIGPKAKRVEI